MKQPFSLPWWFKIIGYFLAFIFAAASIFFIIIQGITFGDEKVRRWLTSLVISVLASLLIVQPIEVALLAFLFVAIFRKADDERDFEFDHLDDGRPLNYKYVKVKESRSLFIDIENFQDGMYKKVGFESLENDEIDEARLRRINEIKMWKLLREIFFYSMFVWILVIVSYGNTDNNFYVYQKGLKNMFKFNSFDQVIHFK